MKKIDVTGQRFGRLVAKKFVGSVHGRLTWRCLCDCGKEKYISSNSLRENKTISCGCVNQERLKSTRIAVTHDLSRSRFYQKWAGVLQRCTYKNHISYKRYGDRGIKICKRWLKFENFKGDMYAGYLSHCKKFGENKTTLDRINTNKNYYKLNCRWATPKQQARNRSNNRRIAMAGRSLLLVEWAEKFKMNPNKLRQRINRLIETKKLISLLAMPYSELKKELL